MATLNYNGTANAGTTVEVWSEQAIVDRRETAIFEYMKDYSNMIIRQDDAGLRSKYPQPNEGYTMTYMNKAKLIGKGQSGQTGLVGKEEKRVKNEFSYTAGFRRHAIACDEYVQNFDILEAEYLKEERADLVAWQGRDKEKQDIARMISGSIIKSYGNGAVASIADLTTDHIVDNDTFVTLKTKLTDYNASPVWFSSEAENSNMYRGYVMLIDETEAEKLFSQSDDYMSFIETFFQGYGYDNPMAKVMYGKKQNLAIIPVEPEAGFGSPLKPSLIVGTTASAINNGANADVFVGLPKWDGTSAFSTYTNDANGVVAFTAYLSTYLTATGTTITGVPAKAIKVDGSVLPGLTIKLAGATTDYKINIKNESGEAYTPTCGDRIVVMSHLVMGIGAEAYISHQSVPQFITQVEDYGMENGVGVKYWEGGTLVKDSRNISNRVVLNFLYAS